MFAPTPRLEALRAVLSIAATQLPGDAITYRNPSREGRVQLSLVGISKEYVNAIVGEANLACVPLPVEHPSSRAGSRGRLLRYMYGTRKAAEDWQDECSSAFIRMGFRQGTASTCLCLHPRRRLYGSAHGGDFTCCGLNVRLDWFEDTLASYYALSKRGRMGPGVDDMEEATVLNRVVRWTEHGLQYEAGPRQGETPREELGLDGGTNRCATPSVKRVAADVVNYCALERWLFTTFKGYAVQANYLAPDRPDVQRSAKGNCRDMAAPPTLSMKALKRVGRDLRGRPRLVYTCPYQTAEEPNAYSDTDWAGCARTRKKHSWWVLNVGYTPGEFLELYASYSCP